MMIAKSNANEYLLIGKNGELYNKGRATFAFLFPGQSATIVPASQQKTSFAMTQESEDGISLRFKGVVIYHIENPETTALKFDFSSSKGIEMMNELISEMCYGEIRDKVSQMTMNRCIHERKTTLSHCLKEKLQEISYRSEINKGWGIQIDSAQVAQVFIVEDEIREQLESELRNKLKADSELSDINTAELIKKAKKDADIKEKEDGLANEKREVEYYQHKMKLQKTKNETNFEESINKFKQDQRLEIEKSKLEIEKQKILIESEKTLVKEKICLEKMKKELYQLKNDNSMIEVRSKFEIEKEKLEIQNSLETSKSLGTMFHNANLSFFDTKNSLEPIFDLITQRILTKK
jgi:hypothetical protein